MKHVGLLPPLVLFASGLAACAGESGPPGGATSSGATPRPVTTLHAGDLTLRIDPDHADVSLSRGDTLLLDFPADAFQLGIVSAVDDAVNYDPYALVVPSVLQPPPDGLAWLAVEAVGDVKATAETVTIPLSYAGGVHATLRFDVAAKGRFSATLTPDAEVTKIAYLRLRPRADKEEGFYGLGEYFDDVNSRGKVRAMQIEIDGDLESSYNEAHVPVPFVIGTRGWGLFIESAYPGVFSVATEAEDLVEATFGTGLASPKGLAFHLFGEERPLDITRHYYDVTGYPRLPARWALGPWVWRDESKDQAEVEGDLEAMRALDLPATGYWIDRPYASGVNTFDFNPPQFPDPQAMITKLQGLGFRTALWHTPYLDEKDAKTAALREEATTKGYYPPQEGVLINKWGKPVDLTNPDAYAWWQGLIQKYTSMGIEGFKLDYGEDVVPGLTNARNVWKFADGSDERTMHGRFQLFYHRVYVETLPEEGGFLLCRHGMYGDQANVSVVWPGDLQANFSRHRDKLEGDSKLSVGGLPAALIAGVGLGPSGFPFYGSDTGGYRSSPPDKELFTRWFQQTALSTVMQIGNSASTVAWEPDAATGYDEEMLGWYRTYTRLHLRLFPYVWTYAKNLAKDGRAIQRPLGLAYPELGVHPNDTYMFGDSLLVAPVVDRGVTERKVVLPTGRWIDWWDGKVYEGGQTITVAAPLDKLPLFLADGGIVPMLRPTIDTMGPTTEPLKVDSYATTAGVLYVRVAAGASSSFTVFDGAALGQTRAGGKTTLSVDDGSEFKGGTVFEVIAAGKKPTGVDDGGKALPELASLAALEAAESGWAFVNGVGGTVFVKVPSGQHQVVLTQP